MSWSTGKIRALFIFGLGPGKNKIKGIHKYLDSENGNEVRKEV
jgi:hypothetical protein